MKRMKENDKSELDECDCEWKKRKGKEKKERKNQREIINI
jgi:hypothetical protein